MGGGEAGTASSKAEKTSSVQEHNGVQQYPDWATMQAYYGPGIPMPPHYFGTTTVASGHAPHHPYMWGPQPMMPPFGTPYPAIYPHSGVYPHPSSSLTAQDKSNKTSNNGKDQVQTKKLKGPDGSAYNGRDKNDTRSQSSDDGTEGSSDGSDGNNGKQGHGKLPLEDSAAATGATAIRVSSAAKANISAPVALSGNPTTPGRDGVHSDLWVQKGFSQDERELKRERRKQSNRESARRSRLRKQAETEELAEKVEALKSENLALKTEISRLSENSTKLRQENAALLDKLNSSQATRKQECSAEKPEPLTQVSPRGETENFLSKINDQSENTGKHQQLLEPTKANSDAVTAN